MNTLLLTPADLREPARDGRRQAFVEDERAAHLIRNLEVSEGARVRVAVRDEGLGWGDVVTCSSQHVVVAFDVSEPPPPKEPLTLVVGLPRPKAARRLLLDAASLGLERIVLLGTWRVPKSYWQSPLLEADRIERQVDQGLALAGDCVRPEVLLRPAFKPFVEDELPRYLRSGEAWLADPSEDVRRAGAAQRPSVVCIGPDRGFTEYEREALLDAGCHPVSLGPRTLRVSTAAFVALGRATLG